MTDNADAGTTRSRRRVRAAAVASLVMLLLAAVASIPTNQKSGAAGDPPIFRQAADGKSVTTSQQFKGSGDVVFRQTASGVYAAVDDDGLPLVTAREPNYARSFEELVAYSADVLAGVVESVTPIRQEGYPTPTLYFYDMALRVTDSATDSGYDRVVVELNNVKTPFVGASWPAEGSTVLAFVIPDPLRRDTYRLVSSQGLYLVDESFTLTPAVSDAVAGRLQGDALGDVMADVRSTMSDIDSGRLRIDLPTDRPIWVGPGNGDDPAEEAKKYASDRGSEAIEPEVFEEGVDHEGG